MEQPPLLNIALLVDLWMGDMSDIPAAVQLDLLGLTEVTGSLMDQMMILDQCPMRTLGPKIRKIYLIIVLKLIKCIHPLEIRRVALELQVLT